MALPALHTVVSLASALHVQQATFTRGKTKLLCYSIYLFIITITLTTMLWPRDQCVWKTVPDPIERVQWWNPIQRNAITAILGHHELVGLSNSTSTSQTSSSPTFSRIVCSFAPGMAGNHTTSVTTSAPGNEKT